MLETQEAFSKVAPLTPCPGSPNPPVVNRIYLDHNASTPVCPEARGAMITALDQIGNPSSIHWAGQAARKALDDARAKVARIFNVTPGEILFTSGGTEAANLAIKGILGNRTGKSHVIASSVEHHCVLDPLRSLERSGAIEVTWLPVDKLGRIGPEEIRRAIRPATRLICMMFANNETGNIHPIAAIGRIAREAGVPFFCDGVQATGKLPIDLKLLPVDLFSFSAHKFYGPKGVGGLFVRKGLRLASLIAGGGQEMGRRGGTENLPGIIALAAALERSYRDLEAEMRRGALLRDRLQQGVLDIPGSRIHGDPDHRLPNTLNCGFEGIDSETILVALDREGVAASSGSACTSGTIEPSHVLIAMGIGLREARGAVRFSLGKGTTGQEIEELTGRLPEIVERLRK